MSYIEPILTLFAIVDPVGNIPMLLNVTEHVPQNQSQKAFNTAVVVGMCILVLFTFAGEQILTRIFHIEIHDLKIAGGILLLIIAIDHLIFGTLRRSVAVSGTMSPYEIGCVPLACPMLAGPGAMVTSLTSLKTFGPAPALIAIFVVFSTLWLIMRFVQPLQKLLGRLFCMVFSKVMCLFIASIGVRMIMSSLQHYFVAAR
jgi:multiple antibiotic resistance protein